MPTRPTSGSVKVAHAEGVVAAERLGFAAQVRGEHPGLPDRDVGERAAAGDVADRVEPRHRRVAVDDPHVVVDGQ